MVDNEIASLVLRGSLGAFFAISGFHKLFDVKRRATLKQTFIDDGVYNPAMMWLIPMGEFFGGLAIILGFLTPLAAVGLATICMGACVFDGVKRVRAWKPIDFSDEIDDYLYLPEVLYIIMLIVLIDIGPGPHSLDAILWGIQTAAGGHV